MKARSDMRAGAPDQVLACAGPGGLHGNGGEGAAERGVGEPGEPGAAILGARAQHRGSEWRRLAQRRRVQHAHAGALSLVLGV